MFEVTQELKPAPQPKFLGFIPTDEIPQEVLDELRSRLESQSWEHDSYWEDEYVYSR